MLAAALVPSVYLYFDRPGAGGRLLRHPDLQHAIPAFRLDRGNVGILGQPEAARETAVKALDAMELLVLLLGVMVVRVRGKALAFPLNLKRLYAR